MKQKEKEYRLLAENFKKYLNTEMAVSPEDIKVFSGKNFSAKRLATRLEELIDESLGYINTGKKGERPAYLDTTSVSRNDEIILNFSFSRDSVSHDSVLINWYAIIRELTGSWGEKAKGKREKSSWLKTTDILKNKYINAGWSDVYFDFNDTSEFGTYTFVAKLTK